MLSAGERPISGVFKSAEAERRKFEDPEPEEPLPKKVKLVEPSILEEKVLSPPLTATEDKSESDIAKNHNPHDDNDKSSPQSSPPPILLPPVHDGDRLHATDDAAVVIKVSLPQFSDDQVKASDEIFVEENNNDVKLKLKEVKNDEKLDDLASKINALQVSIEAVKKNEKIDDLANKVDALKVSVDSLKGKIIPEIAKPREVQPSDERIERLILCRNLKDVLELFSEFSYNKPENVLACDLCYSAQAKGGSISGQFKYDQDLDQPSEKLNPEFSHLKCHLKVHLSRQAHIENWSAWRKIEEENQELISRSRLVGMRIARICYDMYKNGKSLRSFEMEIVKAVRNDCDLGDLNHSKHFPEKFRPYVAQEIRRRTVKYVSNRLEQTGFLPAINVQADKGTTVHSTRQFTTVALVVPGSEALITNMYLGQPIVKCHTGRGVSESIVEELQKFQIHESQIEGGSFDGQYFHLSVGEHLTELLGKTSPILCSWDPLHKIGVAETHIRKDKSFQWLVSLTETCQQIYKKFSWGKNYQALVDKCELLEMSMRNLKVFSTTRFPNSVRALFDTLIDVFKPVVNCLRDIIENNKGSSKEEKNRSDDAKAILRKIVNKSFILQLSGTSDIYENFGHVANICQTVDLLPHERFDNVMERIGYFDVMLRSISHDNCKETDPATNIQITKCHWPRYHACLESLKTDKFMGVVVKPDYESKAYNTKLTKKKNNLELATKVEDVTRSNLSVLVKRLGSDLKNDTFEKDAVEAIELSRNVCDLRKFAVEVRKKGSVQTSHILGGVFKDSAKKLTTTLDEIPDAEMKENFAKFLNALESYTKNVEVKDLDSKTIIKDFLKKPELYRGVELTLHSVTVAAVKISVESVVESLVSRYEQHFDSARQLTEEKALDEMEISENGPAFVKADTVLNAAMDNYWKSKKSDNFWHFIHKSHDIRAHSGESKVVKKCLNMASRLPFMDE